MTDLHRIILRIAALADEEKNYLIAALAKSALIEISILEAEKWEAK